MKELVPSGIALGVDEVGRGPLAGPLTVACVALPDSPQIVGIDDSKKVPEKRRQEIAQEIREIALGIGVSCIEPDEIDAAGMSASLKVAMSRAIDACTKELESKGLAQDITAVLIDGNPVHVHEKEQTIVKGDGKVACIAAASIIAKVTRDSLMSEYAQTYPAYGFESNKGYGSVAHIAAIKQEGPCPIHRMSFLGNILAEQQSLL